MPYVQARVRFSICALSDADRILVMRYDEGTAVYEILRVHRTSAVKWVDYMYYRYLWNGRSWVKIKYELQEMSFSKLYDSHASGLTQFAAEERIERYGANALDVPVPSYFKLFYTEVIHPFYIFQIASVAIWLWDDYWIYASCIAVMAIASAIFSVWQARKNREMLAEMCYSESVVRVVRRRPTSSPATTARSSHGHVELNLNPGTMMTSIAGPGIGDELYFENIPSREIAPGDLVEIRADTTVPCDLLLIQGQCVINESALTGESVPVAKVTIPHKEHDIFHTDVHGPKHVLFNGTGVVQTRPDFAPHSKRPDSASASSAPSASSFGEPSLRLDSYESLDVNGSSSLQEDSNPAEQPLVLGLALSTGFSTAKGDLIRSILFPRPTRFKFYRDSMRFIAVLLCIAMIGLVYTIIIFTKYGSPVASMIKRALDLITITVPPALPIAMSIATAFSVRRLKKASIFCTSPQRINVCGRIDVMCFDKTGTLTEDSLDVHGVLPAIPRPGAAPPSSHVSLPPSIRGNLTGTDFGAFVQELHLSPPALLHALSCCHSLSLLHGNLIGDPLEIKMFEATGWSLVDSGHVVANDKMSSIKTLKFFEFSSLLQRMSVVVEEGSLSLDASKADGGSNVWVYSKGAPEVIKTLCLPSSLPPTFDAELSSYTQQGKRVLALARKRMPQATRDTASSISRPEAEQKLEFLGLFVLQNQLKDDTTNAILNISGGSVANVMVTGDNEFTAMNVARQCGILAESEALGEAAVYLITLDFENDIPTGLCYTYIPGIDPDGPDGESRRHTVVDMHLSASTGDLHDPMFIQADMPESSLPDAEMINLELGGSSYDSDMASSYGSSLAGSYSSNSGYLPRPTPTMGLPPSIGSPAPRMGLSTRSTMRSSSNETKLQYSSINHIKHDNVLFAVHGKAFDYIRVNDRKLFAQVLKFGRVYARMTPFDKSHLIEGLQTLGHTVGMCGDGANDVGALKAADVGLSLSDAEASVAAPFTSKVPSIRSMWTLLREGRCALASSIACYKYMACYSMIQLITCVLLYSIWWDSRLTDPQFLWIDIFLVFPLSFFMGATKPREELSSRKPPGALVSLSVVGSVILQTILHFLSQLLFFIYLSKSYIPQYHPDWDLHTSTIFRVGALFLFANFEYIGTCLAYSISKPWRKGLWTNYTFGISLVLLFAGNVWMTFWPPNWLARLLQLSDMEMWLKITLFIAAILEMVVAWGIERFIIIIGVQPYEERTGKLTPLENWADDPKVPLEL